MESQILTSTETGTAEAALFSRRVEQFFFLSLFHPLSFCILRPKKKRKGKKFEEEEEEEEEEQGRLRQLKSDGTNERECFCVLETRCSLTPMLI